MEIRKYQVSDKLNCQNICLATAEPAPHTKKEADVLLILYNDYYTETEPDFCYVLTDNRQIVGYIISSLNYSAYKQVFRRQYLPRLKKLSFLQYITKRVSIMIEALIAKKFPSHLHIDILPGYTGQGFGGKMISQAIDALQHNGSDGVFLGVSCFNKRAIKFYKKHGFKKKLTLFPFVCYMTKSL